MHARPGEGGSASSAAIIGPLIGTTGTILPRSGLCGAADHDHRPPRPGHLDLTGFFHALAGIGYTGPVTFESFSSAVVAPGLSGDLAIWRDLWDDGADLARHAHGVMSAGLAAAGRR